MRSTDHEIRKRAHMGGIFLILAFAVMFLDALGLIALRNARTDELLAVRMADAIQEYYEADGQGEKFLQRINQRLKGIEADDIWPAGEFMKRLSEESGQDDANRFCSDIFLDSGQSLRVELCVDWKKRKVRVCSWMIFPGKETQKDPPIKVWDGG